MIVNFRSLEPGCFQNQPTAAGLHARNYLLVLRHSGDWNRIRIRCVGALPVLTTWINDVKIAELDAARFEAPGYDAKDVAAKLGREGHIAFEVHNNDPKIGKQRWWPGAVCRWRSIRITPIIAPNCRTKIV